LKAGESKELPLVFFIDPDLPKHIKKLTLSYTIFDITANTEIATRSS
jgi:cytochrome c oxidase assembly protein subunit 11